MKVLLGLVGAGAAIAAIVSVVGMMTDHHPAVDVTNFDQLKSSSVLLCFGGMAMCGVATAVMIVAACMLSDVRGRLVVSGFLLTLATLGWAFALFAVAVVSQADMANAVAQANAAQGVTASGVLALIGDIFISWTAFSALPAVARRS